MVRNVGRHYYVDRKFYSRVSKPDLQSSAQKEPVILNLFQELVTVAKRMPPTLTLTLKGGRENFVCEAQSKELNVLTSYRLNNFKKKTAFTLAEGATHVDMSDNICRVAFTLAEVLITLAIIGVVAAMTIPTLVSSYKKKIVETRLVKVYSTFNQAIKMSETENGPLTTWDVIEEAREYDEENQSYVITQSNIVDWYDKYIAPYIKTAKVDKNITTDKDKKIKVWMPDGSLVLISSSSWLVYPNANDYREGEYGENTGLTDRNKDDCGTKYFTFYFNPRTDTITPKYHYGKGLEPYLGQWDGTEEMLRNDDRLGCRKESVSNERAYCTQLIRMNNWKIPDDYPLKF